MRCMNLAEMLREQLFVVEESRGGPIAVLDRLWARILRCVELEDLLAPRLWKLEAANLVRKKETRIVRSQREKFVHPANSAQATKPPCSCEIQ